MIGLAILHCESISLVLKPLGDLIVGDLEEEIQRLDQHQEEEAMYGGGGGVREAE